LPVKFGTSGLRGLATDLLVGAVETHARAFARYLRSGQVDCPRGDILVASDLRDSSPAIKQQVMDALCAEGFGAVDCGTVPTPVLACAAMARSLPAVMVTGSHIPAERNGLKFYLATGEISKVDEAAISALAGAVPARDVPHGAVATLTGLDDAYLQRYRHCLPRAGDAGFASGRFSGFRIGVFEHSTVARDMLVEMLCQQGAEVLRLGRSDAFVALDTESVASAVQQQLQAWCAEHQLFSIISADGDGDRPLMTDERGDLIRGDLLGIITAGFLGADAAVTPLTSNSGVERNMGCPVLRTRVGSPAVIEGIEEAHRKGYRTVVGFEANGGVLLGDDVTLGETTFPALPTRDCFLPIFSVLSVAARERVPLSHLMQHFALPVAAAGKLDPVPDPVMRGFIDTLKNEPALLQSLLMPLGQVAAVDSRDGLRVTLAGGHVVFLRASGNEPALRCYVEADSAAQAADLLQAALRRVAGHLGLAI
jgi:phosphomannomutase